MSDVTRADVCAAAIADAFKDDGEIFGSPMGLLPMLGVRLAKLTSNPDLVISDGESLFLAGVPPLFAKGDVVEGWIPFRKVFDVVAYGKRHVMMGATQVDRHGNQNISAIGDWAQPKRQLLGSRGAPGNTVNNRTSYWVPEALPPRLRRAGRHRLRRRAEARQGGRPGGRALQRHPPDRQQPRRLRRRGRRRHASASSASTRASPSTRSARPPASSSTCPPTCPTTREPTTEELILIREVLDPKGLRFKEVAGRMIDQLLRTPFTDLVGVRHPVVQTGMGWVVRPAPGQRHRQRRRPRHPRQRDDDLRGARAGDHRGQGPHRPAVRRQPARRRRRRAGPLPAADRVRREGRVVRARAQARADRQAQGARHRRDAVDRRRQARGEGRRLGRRRGDGAGRRGRRPHRPACRRRCCCRPCSTPSTSRSSRPVASSTAAASPPRCRTAPPASAWAPASC